MKHIFIPKHRLLAKSNFTAPSKEKQDADYEASKARRTSLKDYGYWEDNPATSRGNYEWLYYEAKRAKRRGKFGSSSQTAGFHKPLLLPTKVLIKLPGFMEEHLKIDDSSAKLQEYTRNMKDYNGYGSFPAISVGIVYNGKAGIYEGNHRLRAAVNNKIEYIPVRITYSDGGEMFEKGALYPLKVLKLMKHT